MNRINLFLSRCRELYIIWTGPRVSYKVYDPFNSPGGKEPTKWTSGGKSSLEKRLRQRGRVEMSRVCISRKASSPHTEPFLSSYPLTLKVSKSYVSTSFPPSIFILSHSHSAILTNYIFRSNNPQHPSPLSLTFIPLLFFLNRNGKFTGKLAVVNFLPSIEDVVQGKKKWTHFQNTRAKVT